jgi:leucyl aminopeptidase (aminopeptidase T)
MLAISFSFLTRKIIQSLESVNLEQFETHLSRFDRIIPIYDIHSTENSVSEIQQKQILRQKIHQYFDKVTRLCDLSEDFNDFFRLPHSYFVELHQSIINAAENIETITIQNSFGTKLIAKANPKFSWVNVNGINPSKVHGTKAFFFEPMLGEVATYSSVIDGVIQFTGSILFSNRQNWTTQLIIRPIHLEITQGRITHIHSEDEEVCRLLKNKFSEHEFSAHLTEIGIGTHPGIRLKGQNLIFEERHAGAHIGFGGMKGSNHMDFVFADSIITFDERVIFNKEFFV